MDKNIGRRGDMGLYIHIPFCHTKCIYCDFPAYPHLDAYHQSYVEALIGEISRRADGSSVSTIYFGGGTPSILPIDAINTIMKAIYKGFQVQKEAEITLESNPGDYGRDQLKALCALGFNRISFGLQTFDNRALTVLGRSHTVKEAIDNVCLAAAVGFEGLNLDLIYGLPGQTKKDVRHNIEVAASLPINHVSMYGLQLEKGTRLSYLVDQGSISLPDLDQVDAMYDTMVEGLSAKGFERYEISNFARQGHYSHHNLRYWLYDEYLGFGAGASSFYRGQRITNTASVVNYCKALSNGLAPAQSVETIDQNRGQEDFCFLGLRTAWGIQAKSFRDLFGNSVEDQFGSVIEELCGQGLLQVVPGGYALTALGAKHGNYVFEQFIRD